MNRLSNDFTGNFLAMLYITELCFLLKVAEKKIMLKQPIKFKRLVRPALADYHHQCSETIRIMWPSRLIKVKLSN